MELFAAIDILGGRARRLVRGDYGRPIDEAADPLDLARAWVTAGVRRLHVVDLDGARIGRRVNADLVGEICRLATELAPGARVQAGGGLRDAQSVGSMLDAGVHEVILGSAAIIDPTFLRDCAARWPARVGAALDLRAGRPQVAGWTQALATEPFALAERLLRTGASKLIVTDVARDGTGAGPNLELMAAFRARFPAAVLLAAGGIAGAADLADLALLGVDGAVVGRALLDGSLEVSAALAACAAGVPA